MKNQIYHYCENDRFCPESRGLSDDAVREVINQALADNVKHVIFTDRVSLTGKASGEGNDTAELISCIERMDAVKEIYAHQTGSGTEILYALETDYASENAAFYPELKAMTGIDFLILNQFIDSKKDSDYRSLCDDMIAGIKTQLFDIVVCPDKAFEKCEEYTMDELNAVKELIWAAAWDGVYLKKGDNSTNEGKINKEEFWSFVPARGLII